MSEQSLREGERALDAVQDHPDATAATARGLLDRAGIDGTEAEVVARFALGRAHHELGKIADACRVLRRAAENARALELTEREAHIRTSLGLSLIHNSDAAGAFAELDWAEARLTGAARARVVMQRAILLVHVGDLHAGLDAFNRALQPLLDEGDDLAALRLISSRGTAHALLGDLDSAERDFLDGDARAQALTQTMTRAMLWGNVAFVHGRRGDVPTSLAWFERARQLFADTSDPGRLLATLETDLCEVLLLAGLWREATEAAERALTIARPGKNAVQEAEAQLLLARALLVGADPIGARREAAAAADKFREAKRTVWAAQARYIEAQADSGEPLIAAEELGRIADDLEQNGWSVEAVHARTLQGRRLLGLGDVDGARTALASAAAARRRGTADQRIQAWHATALLRLAEGNRAGARRALTTAMTLMDQHHAALGATELRVRSAIHAEEIAELGLRLALDAGRPSGVLSWVERARANALRVPPARPPDDELLGDALVELRTVESEIRGAIRDGAPTAEIERRQVGVERRIRNHARLAIGSTTHRKAALDVRSLRNRLANRILVEYLELDDVLYAVVVDGARSRLRTVGPLRQITDRLNLVLFGIRRLASDTGSRASGPAIAHGLAMSTQTLDELLLHRIDVHEDAEVVVVPSAGLRSLPWSALPSARRRPVSVAPSAAVWLRSPLPVPACPRVTLVAGPDLDEAVDEVRSIRSLYDDASVLVGRQATSKRTLAAAEGADILHIAAHGSFRSDSPLFSALDLADGPLTIYDLERLRDPPRLVVLSACHAGASETSTGDEVTGTSMALIGLGVQTVVAPLVAVGDAASAEAMIALHHELCRGATVPRALQSVVSQAHGDDPHTAATAAAFVTIGSDPGGR